MNELSETQIPPGGWQWREAQTGWTMPNPVSVTLGQATTLLIKHRMANPATLIQHNLSVDPPTVKLQIINYQKVRLGIPLTNPVAPKTTPPALPALSGAVQQAVAVVKKLATGAAILMEWDESGLPPVDAGLSQGRAATCSTCPKNDREKKLTDYFTEPVARAAERKFERLHQLNLKTAVDDQLGVCRACLCPLKLKVHVPLELINKRLKPEFRAELDPGCWILRGT